MAQHFIIALDDDGEVDCKQQPDNSFLCRLRDNYDGRNINLQFMVDQRGDILPAPTVYRGPASEVKNVPGIKEKTSEFFRSLKW